MQICAIGYSNGTGVQEFASQEEFSKRQSSISAEKTIRDISQKYTQFEIYLNKGSFKDVTLSAEAKVDFYKFYGKISLEISEKYGTGMLYGNGETSAGVVLISTSGYSLKPKGFGILL